jgi:hypothetical protein
MDYLIVVDESMFKKKKLKFRECDGFEKLLVNSLIGNLRNENWSLRNTLPCM